MLYRTVCQICQYIFAGPVVPDPPLLGTVATFSEKATISFTVSSVVYDLENYTVMHGTTENDLTTVSGIILSTADPNDLSFLNAINISYSINVEGLVSFQKYYFVIAATNSVGSTNSTLSNFITSEAREEQFLPFVLL